MGNSDEAGRVPAASAADEGKRYPCPAVAADVVIVRFEEEELELLLIERRHDPYAGRWALPGGFVEMTESVEAAALREAAEETGLSGFSLLPLATFSAPERDPRTRVISVAFLALLPPGKSKPRAGDDARRAEWFPLGRLPELAFDHHEIVSAARTRLRELAVLSPRILDLLPSVFPGRSFLALCRQVMNKKFSDVEAFLDSLRHSPAFVSAGRAENNDELFRFEPDKYHDGDFMFMLLDD